jgi:hypothetical protein
LIGQNRSTVGRAGPQTARYTLAAPGAEPEAQASSGLIVATGAGATGWCRSGWLERRSTLALPAPIEARLTWFVREAWPAPATGTEHTEGELTDAGLTVSVESDRLVAFGDGVEADNLSLAWGSASPSCGRGARCVSYADRSAASHRIDGWMVVIPSTCALPSAASSVAAASRPMWRRTRRPGSSSPEVTRPSSAG